MQFDRPTFSTRTTFCALPLLIVTGSLRAYATPDSKANYVKPNISKANSSKTNGVKRTGEQVYRQLCAACHGISGEGGKRYTRSLTGDKSSGELAHFIHEEMPPDAPRKLPVEEAQQVAAYIHGAFYSPLAQARNKPARVELSRLTVRQYRNAVTDLIGSFRMADPLDSRRGLAGKYFKTRQGGPPILERVDHEIQFDFGTAGALPAQDDPYQFAMRWQGSVLTPDTGEYEFIVRTEQAATLWVNDLAQPLIDAQVKSGNQNEYRASLFLLGGRVYPLRLEFFKGVRGVDNLQKLKEKPVQKASVTLAWKMPKRTDEVIPGRYLFPEVAAPVFVVTTPFPPDDRSIGYERGTSVSKEWDEATTEAAIEAAGYVAAHLRELSGVADDAKDRDTKLREFCRKFVAQAFRRPLSDEQAQFFVDRRFQNAPNLETGVKRVVLLTLKSPQFLYQELPAQESPTMPVSPTSIAAPASALPTPTPFALTPSISTIAVSKAVAVQPTSSSTVNRPSPIAADPYAVASRLSFTLWDSAPDQELLKAAASGQLVTREQVLQQAQRMVSDQRAWFKMRDFLLQWLKVDNYPALAKDAKKFPHFDEAVASDLRTSLELTLEYVVWGEKSDFRELMLTDKFFLNGRLARMYGELLDSNAPFQMVAMDYGRRTGLLTHPYLLASFAYVDNSSPIHRGVLIARNLLGRTLKPPPAAFVPLAADLLPNLTTRQRVSLQTSPAACSSCHGLINPLGFSLEKFDAIGSLRARENDLPVDATGSYHSRAGEEVKFTGASDLAHFLADSEEVHTAFVEKLFQYMVKQPVRAFGPQTLPGLLHSFRANQFNMRQQMVESAVVAACQGQRNHLPSEDALGTESGTGSNLKSGTSDTIRASAQSHPIGHTSPRGIPKT